MCDLGFINDLLHELRRDEIKAPAIAQHDIAGHHRRGPNLHRYIHSAHHHAALIDRSGMHTPLKNRHSDWKNSLGIANRAVSYESRLARVPDGSRQIIADNRPAFDLSEQIYHRHITRLELVDKE